VPSQTFPSPVCTVADYEPPVFGGPPKLPPAVVPQPRRAGAVVGYRMPRHAERSRAAAAFADAALRRVLEVIDRRRPSTQLRPLVAAGLVDSLPVADGADPARLRRVVAQICRPDGTAAEVSASYIRAGRLHAIACRVEQDHTAARPHWRMVALHLG